MTRQQAEKIIAAWDRTYALKLSVMAKRHLAILIADATKK